ncbi:MAG: ferritin-like protein [Solirubrobacteraceae bacterium]|jgi:hypothetical protein
MDDPAEQKLNDLRLHLQAAVELELLLIPPYLCALFSIEPGANVEAALVIRSVVIEEMLHLTLAANILNAVGGTPRVTDRKWVGHYPTRLPHHTRSFAVDVRPFDDTALTTFLAVEHPSFPVGEPPEAPAHAASPRLLTLGSRGEEQYATIGAFYDAVQRKLEQAVAELGPEQVFTGEASRQVGPEHFYASGGTARKIGCLDDALCAFREIVEQGEGKDTKPPPGKKFDGENDLAHFYRYNELRQRRRYRIGDDPLEPTGEPVAIDWDKVYPMQPNLKLAEVPEGELRHAVHRCNGIWYTLLERVETALTGNPDELQPAVGEMWSLKYAMVELMRIRMPNGLHAGPTFELPPVA